jgi:hypothetical protein
VTGAGWEEEGAGAGEGAWAGCCGVASELEPVPLLVGAGAGAGVVAVAWLALWPWNDFAAATETAPVSATAPAIIHRLIRPIRAKPASRALTALLRTSAIMPATCKKTLSQR